MRVAQPPSSFERTYVDTSVWIAMLTQEPNAEVVLSYLERQQQHLLTAEWTRTELASALGIKARRKELTQAQATDMLEKFELWISAGLNIAAVQSDDFYIAAKMCENTASRLRAGDALHLSVAKRHEVTHVFTLDHDMQRCAQSLGMQIIEPYDEQKFTH
jgi:uncharacterized protein